MDARLRVFLGSDRAARPPVSVPSSLYVLAVGWNELRWVRVKTLSVGDFVCFDHTSESDGACVPEVDVVTLVRVTRLELVAPAEASS